MTEHPDIPALPANSTEASARLDVLSADKAWSGKLLSGDPRAREEFNSLTAKVAEGGNDIDRAMSGVLPAVPDTALKTMAGTAEFLRENGVDAAVIRQTLSGHEVTQAEFDA